VAARFGKSDTGYRVINR